MIVDSFPFKLNTHVCILSSEPRNYDGLRLYVVLLFALNTALLLRPIINIGLVNT